MSRINLMLVCYPAFGGEDVARTLLEAGTVDFCFIAGGRKTDLSGQSRYHTVSWHDGQMCHYEPECNLSSLPALSKELLEKMLPYESMAIKEGRRRDQFPVVEYETEKMKYHKNVRFWNYIFDKYDINCVYFQMIPNGPHSYVIYSLAKIRNIPMLCCSVTNIDGIIAYGDSIEAAGNNIGIYYKSIASSLDLRECVLEGPVGDYYKSLNRDINELKKEREDRKYDQIGLRMNTDDLFGGYLGLRGFMRPQRERIHLAAAAILKYHDWGWYKKYKEDVDRIHMASYDIKYYLRHRAVRQKAYNRIAEYPDYGKKYIYFALQLTPEESTMPRAGVFAEQYTSVQLIARAAEKCGVMIYVKEHIVQPFRDKAVYQTLREIPNVKLIKTSVSTYDLMKNSIAVATHTGSVMLEAAIHGKPCLTTVIEASCWKGIPTLFKIEDEDTGAEVIQRLLNGFSVSNEEIQRYLYAIQKCCIIEKPQGIRIKHIEKWLYEIFDHQQNLV